MMSSQRGNVQRTRRQKYQNQTLFKNDLHDKSNKLKEINKLDVSGVCERCKAVIEWKIKYRKYKPLTVPKKCTRCDQKTVRHAYHVICLRCSQESALCAKCGKESEDVVTPKLTEEERIREKSEFERDLKLLSERKRRTLLRYIEKGGGGKDPQTLLNELTAGTSKNADSDDLNSFLDDLSSDNDSEIEEN